ncbi:hypothetical protein [Vagococcus sp. WN89Y]|uniref:hypothetical protein n=1 Tax=Vagococcus sp. WN89Y TaxID=3457258 RepID=UPI003FCC789B
MGENSKIEQVVEQFVANARREQSGVVFFNDTGMDFLILPVAKQRLVEKMAKRILTSEITYRK